MKHCHPLTRRQRATRKQSALNRLPLIASYGVSRSLLFALIIVAALVPVVPVTTQAQEEKRTTSARERFIPAEELDSIFERSPAGVILPRDQFSELLEKAELAYQAGGRNPASILIRSANYQVEQADKHAVVRLSIDIEQFVNQWATVNIPIGNLLIESAEINGIQAAIGRNPQSPDSLTLVHQQAGRFTLQLQLSTPLGIVGSDRFTAFKLLTDSTSTVEVACPADRILLINELKLDRPAPIEQPTKYSFPAGSSDAITLKWTSRQQSSESQTLVFVRSDVQALLSSDSMRWTSESRISVFGNSINQLTARVPASLEVTAIESTGLESWKLEDDPDQTGFTRVLLNYRQPFTEDRLVKFSAVFALEADGTSRIPTLEFVDVTAHTGRLFVNHEDQLRLLANVGGGVRQLGTDARKTIVNSAEVFDFWMQNFQLSVAIKPRDRELFAELNSRLFITDSVATFTCEATIESLNAPLFELPLHLPDGWQVQQIIDGGGTNLRWRASDDAGNVVVEPSSTIPTNGIFNFITTFARTIDDPTEQQTLSLPVLDAVNTLPVGGTYQISTASDLTVSPTEIVGLSSVGDDNGTLLYETQGREFSGTLSIARKPVRLSSRSVLKSWMDARQISTEATVTIDVLNGKTRTLQLLLPESLGTDVRFSVLSIGPVPGIPGQNIPASLAITEQTPGEVVDGQRPFHLTFDKRFLGAVALKTLVQQSRTEESRLNAPYVIVVGAVRQHGLVSFEAYPEQQLDATADDVASSGLLLADSGLVEAPTEKSGRRTALVYRFIQPEYTLGINETRFQSESVPSAVCENIANISVLSNAGTIQRSCRVQFRCTGVQTLRFALPDAEQSFLWSTILNGQAIEVRRDGDDYLVAIPTQSEPASHVLEVLFESSQAETDMLGTTTQQSLKLSIDTDKGTASEIDILEQVWEVRYPATSLLVNQEGGFHPQRGLDKPGFLQSIIGVAFLPSWKTASTQLIPAGFLLLALFVGTALVIRRRWKSLCLVVLLLPLLMLPSFQNTREAARRNSREYLADSIPATPMSGEAQEVELGDNLSGGTELYFDSDYAKGLPVEADFSRAPAQNRSNPGNAPSPPPAFAGRGVANGMEGMEMGGMGAGGMGGMGGMGAANDAGGVLQPYAPGSAVESDSPFGLVPQANSQGIEITGNSITPQFAEPQKPSGGQALSDNTVGVPAPEPPAASFTPPSRLGSARLSIRATVANPNDYRAKHFRSIGGSTEAGTLEVVVQERSRLNALRLMAASTIVLLYLWSNSQTFIRKIGLAFTLLMATAASIPIVPNHWQGLVDGLGLGTLVGIGLWLTGYALCGLTTCCKSLTTSDKTGRVQQTVSTVILVTLSLASALSTSQSAVAQDDESEFIRPDVVRAYSPSQPELLAERVFLSKDEFLKLYRLAYPEEFNDKNAPNENRVVAAFYKSDSRAQIKDSNWSQRFTARFVIRSYSNTPANVPLPIGLVAIQSAKLDGNEAILAVETNQVTDTSQLPENAAKQQQQAAEPSPQAKLAPQMKVSVRVPAAGLHVLDVVFDVPAVIENSVGRIDVPLLPVAAGTVLFELPDKNAEVQINSRSNTFRKDGETLIIPIASLNQLSINWRPSTTQDTTNVIYHATVNSALTLDNTGLTAHAAVTVNCRQGQISELEITIPKDYLVQTVSGNDIAGWSVDESKPESLKLQFKQAIEAETQAELVLFRNQIFLTEPVGLEIPVFSVTGASRDSGNVTILAGRELEVRVDSLSGVTQQNAAESVLPHGPDESLRRILAWRYTRHPAAIYVRAYRAADLMKIRMLNGVQLESQRQLWTTLITADISGAPRRRLEIRVPDDFLALEVTANDLADWYYTKPEGNDSSTKILNIQFNATRQGTISAVIQAQTGRGTLVDESKIVCPIVLNADEVTTNLSVWLDAASRIANTSAESWKRAAGDTSIDPRILQLHSDTPDISFVSTEQEPGSVDLSLIQATPSLIPESVLVTNVTETSLELTQTLKWQIAGAATRELSFSLPAALGDAYDFRIAGLRQLEKKPVGERVQFTVHLQQPVSEQFFILGTATLPLPESKQLVAMPPEFPGNQAKASHFWVIVNQSSGLLQAVDAATDGDDVLAGNIKTKLPEGLLQQSVAIRRLKVDSPNSAWELIFPERQAVTPAVIALAAHTTVVAADGTWRSLHKLQVRNESRQFLPVILPEDSRILFCRVNASPTRIASRDQDDKRLHLIPIPQSGQACVPFTVEFALSGKLATIAEKLTALSVTIPAPEFPEFRDFPDYGITVSRNTWSVYVPREWRASLMNDPRKTNVIEASEDDFEDAILLSAVDNLKSMVNSAKSDSLNRFGNDANWIAQVNEQQMTLQSLTGNSIVSEDLRKSVLQDFEVLREKQIGKLNISGFGSSSGSVNITNNAISGGFNFYLEEQEVRQNGFNNRNSIRLLEDNTAQGVELEAKNDGYLKFRFALPELVESATSGKKLQQSKQPPTESKNKASEVDAKSSFENAPRSQLLERRKSGALQQGQGTEDKSIYSLGRQWQALGSQSQVTEKEQLPLAEGEAENLRREELVADGGDDGLQMPTIEAKGLLSLSFEIPEDGVRHDFVRTGGNAALTLEVRSNKEVQQGFGLLWAGFCAIMSIFVLRNTAKGGRTLPLQFLLLASSIGVVGWLCMPNPIRTFSLTLFVAASVGVCIYFVWQSYRKPAAM